MNEQMIFLKEKDDKIKFILNFTSITKIWFYVYYEYKSYNKLSITCCV